MTIKAKSIIIRGATIVDGTGSEPFEGDIRLVSGRIAAVGRVKEKGDDEIDARGMLATPGFVDIHTHYDGQVTWENCLVPSSNHGVTTVVMGNCGVGFAPCRKCDRDSLIRLMEGVEDVPEIVMDNGLPWTWETFPEYLETVSRRSFDVDIAAMLPHAPLRVYAMGERAVSGQAATASELHLMAELTEEAMRAGAIGFATSRSIFHRDSNGEPICTQDAQEAELQAIGSGMQRARSGVIEVLMDFDKLEQEFALMRRVVEQCGRPLSFTLAQVVHEPDAWRQGLKMIDQAAADGLPIKAQVIGRPTGMLLGLNVSYHPFTFCATYQKLAELSLEQRVAQMQRPDIRAQILNEKPGDPQYAALQMYLLRFDWMFVLGDPPNYAPSLDNSVAAIARRSGRRPEEVAYDLLLENNGKCLLFVTAANYIDGTLDNVLTMLRNENTLLGLGDGGAHYGMICDAGTPTFMMSYWTRDRASDDRLSLPHVIKALSHNNAAAMGLHDRGVIAPGYKGDINVIDYSNLRLHAPTVSFDLPGGGRRLSQSATGYVATISGGVVTYRNGVHTGALPGALIRGAQSIPAR